MLKERESTPLGGVATVDGTVCAGCCNRIQDRYLLLAADKQWHAACLKCCECKFSLDSALTCYARDGNIYCKEDYYRTYAVSRCSRCHAGISANELVMRVKELVYHLHCFSCVSCGVPLAKGDHFGMKDDFVYCRPHYELLNFCESGDPLFTEDCQRNYFSTARQQHTKGRPKKRKLHNDETSDAVMMRMTAATLEIIHQGDLSSSMESLSYESSIASPASNNGNHQHHQSPRTKRMRTSFKHHQLRTMKTYFAINQNPDAKDLKQLAQKTGLSKRVLQVWFQNARAKWRRNIMRQEASQNSNHVQGIIGGSSAVSPNPGSLHRQPLDSISQPIHAIHSQVVGFNDGF